MSGAHRVPVPFARVASALALSLARAQAVTTPAVAESICDRVVRFHADTIPIEPGTSLCGTGEVAGPLKRIGRVTMPWNTDSYAYTDDTPAPALPFVSWPPT